jgi:hypothetical protein
MFTFLVVISSNIESTINLKLHTTSLHPDIHHNLKKKCMNFPETHTFCRFAKEFPSYIASFTQF